MVVHGGVTINGEIAPPQAGREVWQRLCGPGLTRRQELGVGMRGDEGVQRVHGRLLLLVRRHRCVDRLRLGGGLAPLALGRVAAAVAAALPVRLHVLELRRHLVAGLGAAHDNATRQKLRVRVRGQERSHALAVALGLTPLRHGCGPVWRQSSHRTEDALDAEHLDLRWRWAAPSLQHANLAEDLDRGHATATSVCRQHWRRLGLGDNQLLADDPRATARPDDLLSIGRRRRGDVRLQRCAAELAKGAACEHFRQSLARRSPLARRFSFERTRVNIATRTLDEEIGAQRRGRDWPGGCWLNFLVRARPKLVETEDPCFLEASCDRRGDGHGGGRRRRRRHMEAGEREATGAAGATLEADSPPPALPAATGSSPPTTPPPELPHTASPSEYPQRKRAMQAVERCIHDAEAAAQMAATAKDGDADTCASALETIRNIMHCTVQCTM
jgi:hypothetical protein